MLLPGTEDGPASLGEMRESNFYTFNGPQMKLCSESAAASSLERDMTGDAFLADVAMREGSDETAKEPAAASGAEPMSHWTCDVLTNNVYVVYITSTDDDDDDARGQRRVIKTFSRNIFRGIECIGFHFQTKKFPLPLRATNA